MFGRSKPTETKKIILDAKVLQGEIAGDHVSMMAASLAYRVLFALLPFFLLILSVSSLLAGPNEIHDAINYLHRVMPKDVAKLMTDQILSLTADKAQTALSIGAAFSTALALWALSGLFRSLMECMNIIYDTEETRSLLRRYSVSFMLAVISVVLFAGSFSVTLLGSWWIVLPILFVLVIAGFASIYYLAPNVDMAFKLITPGTVFATIGWLLFSILFSLYVDKFGSYNKTYGAMAGIILFLLYTYFTSMILFIGGEINQIYKDKKWLL